MTRSSGLKKTKPIRKSSKLSGLRRKLTLKHALSPVHLAETSKINEPEDNREDIHVVNNSDHGVEPVICNVNVENEKIKKSIFFQRASPMKLVRLYPRITDDQKALIVKHDYGGLLEIKCSKLKPELCQFLMDSFDPSSCSLVFPGRGSIPLTEESVKDVIGVPMRNLEVLFGQDADAMAFMKEQFGTKGRKQPAIIFLEEKLASMRPANSKFLRFFIMYSMCSVLAPTTGVRISPRVYPSLVNMKQAKDLNMCRFVIMILRKALKGTGESEKVQPCMLYLMVKYLDSLQLENMEISDEGTRVYVWTNALIKEAIRQDRRSDGSFGAAPLKPVFASTGVLSETETATSGNHDNGYPVPDDIQASSQEEQNGDPVQEDVHDSSHQEQSRCHVPEEVEEYSEDGTCRDANANDESEKDEVQNGQSILFADPEVINKFIEKNAPANRTDEDTERYRYAIEYACHGFEAGLLMLFKNLPAGSSGQSKASESYQPSSLHKIKESPPKKCNENINRKPVSKTKQREPVSKTKQREPVSKTKQREAVSKTKQSNIVTQGHTNLDESLTVKKREEIVKNTTTDPMKEDQCVEDIKKSENVSCGNGNELNTNALEKSTNSLVPDSSTQNAQVSSQIELTVQENNKPGCLEEMVDSHIEVEIKNVEKDKENIKTPADPELQNLADLPCKYDCMEVNSDRNEGTAYMDCSKTANSEGSIDTAGDHSSVSEGKKREQFFEFMRSERSSPGPKIKIPQFELPEFLDMEAHTSHHSMRELVKDLNPMECNTDGLINFLDGSLPPECKKLLEDMEPKKIGKKRKNVTFADEEKMRTAQKSRNTVSNEIQSTTDNVVITSEKAATLPKLVNSPRRSPRLHPSPNGSLSERQRRNSNLNNVSKIVIDLEGIDNDQDHSRTTPIPDEDSGPNTLSTNVPTSATHDSMSRKLNFYSTESERKRNVARTRGADPPSFDLDTPPYEVDEQAEMPKTIELPVTADNKQAETAGAGCSGPSASITPVARELDKRVIKQGKFGRSPYVNPANEKLYSVCKSVETLYAMVCDHGRKKNPYDRYNGETVIDIDEIFVDLGNLADSVAPRIQMINQVSEVGVTIIRNENQDPKKYIMPLRVSRYLIESRFDLKDVTRCFECTPSNRLDHKVVICFPSLDSFPGCPPSSSDHYWLVNLNLRAQRFEIYDSLATRNRMPLLDYSTHVLIAGIKTMWAREYKNSKV